ncbi:hypothetical protein PIROE2DRAFT_5967 [Piromyces sp. E2]|nr:hypothetical protein PIROE2DRAFT_5967 [Piromyces sp. E2]|eukprot:OUM66754.1 hypothetical protein PIROE2DRAFT_5967 [Piromyces sp. E2]
MINVREDQELSYNMVSVKELLSDSVNNGQGDVYQEYIEEVKANKSFNRSFLNTFKRKSMNRINPLKTTKRKILSLLKKGKDDKDKIHKGSKSMLEDVDTSNQCIPDRNSKTCSLIEPSNDQITNNSIIDNSQYLFIKKKIQNKNNELLANDVSSLSQSLISNNELESIVPLPPSETQFQSSNKIHQKQFSQLNKSDQFYQIKHENNSPTNECKSSLITPPTTPVQTPINQPVVISPLTPESISNSHKDDNNNNNNKQISDSSNMPSSCKSSPKSMVSKSPKTTNQIINETSTEYKTLINLNKDTPPTPEYKSSSTIENKPRKLQKHKKIANNVKKFIKKALSPFSHQNNNLEEKIHIATVDYTTSLSDETDKTNTIDNELMSLSIKKGKRKKEENDILTSSSLSSKNLTSSPENMDSFEDDNLRKTHKINKYNSANNWNSALGQYILKMKKGDKPKKKMSKKSSSSLSNVISIGSKNVSSVLSSSSSTSSSISSTITKNNMTLAATIDSDTIKTNSKNESENDNKRYAFIFDKQKVRQEFEKVKNKENIKKENPKLTSVKKIESKSTLSGSYIDESSGIRMKLDKSEHIELQETEEDKYIESNKPKTELETWNEEDIKSNPLNNTTTEVIEIVEEDDINDNETEDWNTVSESEFDYNSNSNKKKRPLMKKMINY